MSFVDHFGDRMKAFEIVETGRRLDPRSTPVYARLDGRGFSKFTRGMERPYDPRMTRAMQETCAAVVAHTGALIGYTQSDEISLVWSTEAMNDLAEMLFDGKIQKMTSVLASYATAAFTQALLNAEDPEFRAYVERMPHFDARFFSLPTLEDAADAILWRTKDAERNAVQMVAQANYSHRALQGVSIREILNMFERDAIPFDAMPEAFKFGSFYRRQSVMRPIEERVRQTIPENVRPEASTLVQRSEVARIDEISKFSDVANRSGVMFRAEAPQLKV